MSRRSRDFRSPETCPACGAEVPAGALACPECGADERTGWAEDAEAESWDDAGFDYDGFVEREFGESPSAKPRDLAWGWWALALLLIVALGVVLVF